MLELLDYRDVAGAWPEPPPGRTGWGEVLAETWRALPIDSELGLLASEEDPADDPASMPYLLSTQLLLWYTATRLLIHAGELRLDAPALAGAADTVRAAIRDRFPCPGPFGTQWAYETDGRGRFRRYQDANDLPTALARRGSNASLPWPRRTVSSRDLRLGHRCLAGPPLVRLAERGPRRPRPRRRRSGGAGGATMRHDRQEWPLVRGCLLC